MNTEKIENDIRILSSKKFSKHSDILTNIFKENSDIFFSNFLCAAINSSRKSSAVTSVTADVTVVITADVTVVVTADVTVVVTADVTSIHKKGKKGSKRKLQVC